MRVPFATGFDFLDVARERRASRTVPRGPSSHGVAQMVLFTKASIIWRRSWVEISDSHNAAPE